MRGSPQKIPPLVARQSQLVSQAPTAKSKFAAQNCRTVGRFPSSIVWPRKFSISPLKFESATGTSQRCAVHSVFSTVMGATFKKMRLRTSKFLPLGQARSLLHDTVSKAWAQATWKRRASAWEKFKTWCMRTQQNPASAHSIATFVEASLKKNGERLSPQGRLGLNSALKSVATRCFPGMDTTDLQLQAAGLRHSGALIPMKQAKPIRRSQLLQVGAKMTLRRRAAL